MVGWTNGAKQNRWCWRWHASIERGIDGDRDLRWMGSKRLGTNDPMEILFQKESRWIEPTEWMGETSMGHLAANESKENLDHLGTRYGKNLGELTPALNGGKIQDEKDATNDTKQQAD